MTSMTRREALEVAAAIGASLAWRIPRPSAGRKAAIPRPELFPQGVASGDPTPDSVILWTRRPPEPDGRPGSAVRLTVEVGTDPSLKSIVARGRATLSGAEDWTCRILAAGLAPATIYWFRFTDDQGFASRVGRTLTAPAEDDDRPARLAFVSCENHQMSANNAYRRMIWEDERAAPADQLQFVMHLGDFFYELMWYPEDRPQGMYGRKLRDLVRYAQGEKHGDFHVPTTLDDYRSLYQAYLADPDLQEARARWPFIYMADNHDFSWKGWQSQENFGKGVVPAQTRKVAASKAWFEYQPSRAVHAGSGGLDHFDPPTVTDVPLTKFDDDGLGLEPGNLAAIGCLRRYRAFRWGANVDLILTDNRTYRSQPLADLPGTAPFIPGDFAAVVAQDVTEILDAGREYAGGHPPDTIRYNGRDLPNPRKDAPPQSMLGGAQKKWFLDRLRTSRAPWKLWGNSVAGLDWRSDYQNLPASLPIHWPATGYALFGDDDWSGYRHERDEILEWLRREKITGVVSLCGDRHAFLAGHLEPPGGAPVMVEFVTGSISAPGLFEALEHAIPDTHPLRPLFAYRNPDTGAVEPAINLSITAGVRSCLELAQSHDRQEAARLRNPDVAAGIAFADTGGHGYAVVKVERESLTTEFVCIPRPLERSDGPDGGPLAYRMVHRVALWKSTETPQLRRGPSSGTLPLGAVNPSVAFGALE